MTDFVQLIGIEKRFGGIAALKSVDFTVKSGEVHALIGENGAGKSTLMGVLSGNVIPTAGTISVEGCVRRFSTPGDAIAAGIAMIHQELVLAPDLTVAENIFMNRMPRLIDWAKLRRDAAQILDRLGFEIDPGATIGDLPLAQRQIVEIAKALSLNARLIIFDEPTAVLGPSDARRLLNLIRSLRSEGVAIVYISHRLDEVADIADRVTVLNDGSLIATRAAKDVTIEEMVRLMVGRPISALFGEKRTSPFGAEIFRVESLTAGPLVQDLSFGVRAGEIVGLGGLIGSGRTETARAIFSADKRESGRIFIDGSQVKIRDPRDAVKAGIGLVPEDRRGQGVVIDASIRINTTMTSLRRFSPAGIIKRTFERRFVGEKIAALKVKSADIDAPVQSLSGGNQQKVVIGKWVDVASKVIILDEPTRGVDVGAKSEIYAIIRRLADEGRAVLLISSDHQELFGLCDRVLVMGRGRIRSELLPDEFDEERLLSASLAIEPVQTTVRTDQNPAG